MIYINYLSRAEKAKMLEEIGTSECVFIKRSHWRILLFRHDTGQGLAFN